ncbi:MAG: CpsD/CapB family tyrosine-protein kinase [Phycisphaeraceae bacterium]
MGYIFDAMQQSDDDAARAEAAGRTPEVLPFSAAVAAPTKSAAPAPEPEAEAEAAYADEPSPVLADLTEVREAQSNNGVDDRLIAMLKPASAMAEEYRSIRTGILSRWNNQTHLVHTITSATPQEGKTITSLNLGLCFSELRNRRTIVVEADLRLPQFKNLLDLPDSPGLAHLLDGECRLNDVIHEAGQRNLHVITAGRRVNNEAVQMLSGREMASLIQKLKQKYDHVIIDTPPVVELADAGILGAMSDDVLLIVRMNRTPQPLIDQAIRTLASYNAPVAGIIATDQQRKNHRLYARYGQSYRHQYGRYAEAA